MAVATPPPVPAPPASPTPPPAARPAAAAPPAPPPPPPRHGRVEDEGVARHDSVHAQSWSSRGPTKVLAEVDAAEATLAGGTSIGGALTADSVRSDGDLEVRGAVDVSGSLTVEGMFRSRSTLHAGDATFRGRAHLDGAVRVDRLLDVHGLLAAPSVQAGGITLDGVAEVDGALDAPKVEARFRASSRIGTIQAQTVSLSVRSPNPMEMVLGRNLAVHIARIEAETVDLEGVDVAFVRAREIVLGRNAHVSEFAGHVTRRHSSARVGPESRSPPPHGLTR